MVAVPSKTMYFYGGNESVSGSGAYTKNNRYYYHVLRDQFGDVIDWILGVPCSEVRTWHSGMTGYGGTPPGSSTIYGPDGGFSGGVAQRDHLACDIIFDGIYHQDLFCGVILLAPRYDMYLRRFPNPSSGFKLWKEIRSLP
jgi:hypothetical protein